MERSSDARAVGKQPEALERSTLHALEDFPAKPQPRRPSLGETRGAGFAERHSYPSASLADGAIRDPISRQTGVEQEGRSLNYDD